MTLRNTITIAMLCGTIAMPAFAGPLGGVTGGVGGTVNGAVGATTMPPRANGSLSGTTSVGTTRSVHWLIESI